MIADGADCVLLVCNPREGVVVIKNMAAIPSQRRVPIVSHWGITGGGLNFFKEIQRHLEEVDLTYLQSYSFLAPPFKDRASHVCNLYREAFGKYESPKDIFSPAGTAHAYELVHLLAKAIARANSAERPAVRDALENLGPYQGLIRDYAPPFTPDRHDALTPDDLQICRFGDDGAIIPIDLSRVSMP